MLYCMYILYNIVYVLLIIIFMVPFLIAGHVYNSFSNLVPAWYIREMLVFSLVAIIIATAYCHCKWWHSKSLCSTWCSMSSSASCTQYVSISLFLKPYLHWYAFLLHVALAHGSGPELPF